MKNTLSIISIAFVLLMVPFSKSQAQIEGKKYFLGINGAGNFPKRAGGSFEHSFALNLSVGYFIGKRVVFGISPQYSILRTGTYPVISSRRSTLIGLASFLRVFLINSASRINFYLEPNLGLFKQYNLAKNASNRIKSDFGGHILSINAGLVYFISANTDLELRYSHGAQRYKDQMFQEVTFRNLTIGLNFYL